MIKKKYKMVIYFTLIASIIIAISSTINAAAWSSSDKWAEYSTDGYTIRNDVWGSGAGSQTIWANSYSNWGVVANHPNTGGVKSYPHVAKMVNKKLSTLNSCNSSFNVTRPGSGSYSTAYDIWCDNSNYEIMLWMNKTGSVWPISGGVSYTNVNVGGHTWNVYTGSNGANKVFSFVRTANIDSATVNIKDILNWIKGKGLFGDVTLGDAQFGFEITSSSGGLNFNCNSYSLNAN